MTQMLDKNLKSSQHSYNDHCYLVVYTVYKGSHCALHLIFNSSAFCMFDEW